MNCTSGLSVAAGALWIALCPVARSATWHVRPDAAPPGDGRSWQQPLANPAKALEAARPGDEVWLARGEFALSGALRVPSGVALRGGFSGTERSAGERTGINFAHETRLRQTRAGEAVVELAGVAGTVIDGVTLTGARGQSGLVLRGVDASTEVRFCRITGNVSPRPGAGITVLASSRPRVFNLQIADNRTTGGASGGGLHIDATSGGRWEHVILNGNVADGPDGGGAWIQGPAAFSDLAAYFNESGGNGSALRIDAGVTLHHTTLCSNLCRASTPGAPLAVGPEGRVRLTGASYVTGNLRDRDAPQHAAFVDGEERCELRDDTIVSRRETGPADLAQFSQRNDVHVVMPDLFAPPLTSGDPAPGRWVRQTLADRAGTDAYHCVYLPEDWQPGRTYPLLVGFPGNGPFRNRFGDRSGGMPEDNPMGFGVSGGRGYLVLGLGYLDSRRNLRPTGSWWGDVPATIAYTREAVRAMVERYGADPKRVILFGFSRSAIGASFLGLHDDTIAPLWRAFLCYDGWETQPDMTRDWYRHGQSSYGYDPGDFGGRGVARRFARLAGRPLFILGGRGAVEELNLPHRFPVELMAKPHRNHHTSWALRDTPERARVRAWLDQF